MSDKVCPTCKGTGFSEQVYQRATGGLDQPACPTCRSEGVVARDSIGSIYAQGWGNRNLGGKL